MISLWWELKCKPDLSFSHCFLPNPCLLAFCNCEYPCLLHLSEVMPYLTVASFSTDLLQLCKLQSQPGEPRGGGPFCESQFRRQQRFFYPAFARTRRRLSTNLSNRLPCCLHPRSFGFHDGYFVFLWLVSHFGVAGPPHPHPTVILSLRAHFSGWWPLCCHQPPSHCEGPNCMCIYFPNSKVAPTVNRTPALEEGRVGWN